MIAFLNPARFRSISLRRDLVLLVKTLDFGMTPFMSIDKSLN
jgi:hypothetical protein